MRPCRPSRIAVALVLAVILAPGEARGAPLVQTPAKQAAHAPAPSPPARVAAPTPTAAPARPAGKAAAANPDPFRELGAGSPLCREPGVRRREGCRVSGSVANTYPVSNYGLDIQIETRIDRVEANLLAALQSVAALVWLGLVYALKGVLLLIEWAFSLDLLNRSMAEVARAIDRLHQTVIGRPWFMAALAVAGLWGIWRGLVQMQTIRTVVGFAATVALMLASLVVIDDPRGTVGYASGLANDASLGVLSAASTGHTAEPKAGLATAQQKLFDQLVVGPWCALEFGSVRWCRQSRKGVRQFDLWLSYPAEGDERKALYKLTKESDPGAGDTLGQALRMGAEGVLRQGPIGLGIGGLLGGSDNGSSADEKTLKAFRGAVPVAPERVRMQEQGSTFTRLALLALVAVGLAGAICLLLYLALRLVLAGLLALILILLAPAMLLAPAFGDAGREAFVGWAKRLVGALAAKLIFALLLAVVIVAATTLATLPIGWFGGWLLQAAFWWGVLIKRDELLGFLAVGGQGEGQRGRDGSLYRTHRNAKAVGDVAGTAAAAATFLPGRARQASVAATLARQETDRRAVATTAATALDRRADEARSAEVAGACRELGLRPELDRTRRALDAELQPYERDRVAGILDGDSMRRADQTVRESDRAQAREGTDAGRAERAAWRERRRRDLAAEREPSHPTHLRAAAIDPRDYEAASPERRRELVEISRQAMERDRALLGAVGDERQGQPTPKQVKAAAIHLDRDALTRTRASETARVRAERSQRRRRANLHRRR